tara:strand:+ start:817 stop:927 length:111 start_codon:yes stop_codon:yes gene_type:complete
MDIITVFIAAIIIYGALWLFILAAKEFFDEVIKRKP